MENKSSTAVLDAAKEKFELACKQAQSLQIINNFGGAFVAAGVIKMLREAMTSEVMEAVFMPLMNTKIGFLTDRTGKQDKRGSIKEPYSIDVVRDCIIDAAAIGLLPTGNQFNILAERMYPTKEGYTYLLRKMGVKYVIEKSNPDMQKGYAIVSCKISYKYNDEINSFTVKLNIKTDDYSSFDQIQGKAERKAKKALYEYITGTDFGDGDEDSTATIDTCYEDVTNKPQAQPFDVSKLQSESDINTALLRGQISKEEADYLREQLTKSKAAEDISAAVEVARVAASEAKPQDELFPNNK